MSTIRTNEILTGTEWANQHFRLPAGSSQIAGDWVTLPYQIAPLNMMINRAIRSVAWQKSARIGYTKVMVAATLCMAQQFGWSGVIYQPSEDDAKSFVVDEIDPPIAEMPVIQAAFPHWNARDEKNTVSKKVATSFTLDIKGAGTPKNFRRLTKQYLCGDEVDGWPKENGKEGCPRKAARKRLEGAAFPKEIWGTTPTNVHESHIEELMAEADLVFRFHLPCPHCGHEQILVWGDKDSQGGMKWDSSLRSDSEKAKTAHYQCSGCHQAIHYKQLPAMNKAGRWIAEDLTWTRDGIEFFDANDIPTPAPEKIGLHICAIYSQTLSAGWRGLVSEFLECGGDPGKLKAFNNLVLGELWDGDDDNRPDWELLKQRREVWWQGDFTEAPVPDEAICLTGGIDTQDSLLYFSVWAWGAGEECWLVDQFELQGDLSHPAMKEAAKEKLYKTYKKRSGEELEVLRWCWDAMGHKTDDVYQVSKEVNPLWIIPIQGANVYGKPIANMPRKRTKKGVYLTEVGTDNAKALCYGRLAMEKKSGPNPGYIHLPKHEICEDEYLKQLTSANKKLEIKKDGSRVWRWVRIYAFDEALDTYNYALAAVRICQQRFGLELKAFEAEKPTSKSVDPAALGAELGS